MITHERVMVTRGLCGRVQRYHTWPTLHRETVGEHTHRVATLYVQLFGTPRAEVLVYILEHDSGELGAGDLPFYSKREVPELKHYMNRAEGHALERLHIRQPEITKEEWTRFKLCDLLQMLEFAMIERLMGNRLAEPIITNVIAATKAMDGLPREDIDSAVMAVMSGVPAQKDDFYEE